jgi:hypothetical protein
MNNTPMFMQNSGDGPRGSFDQVSQRYGTLDSHHSILGSQMPTMVSAVTINPQSLVTTNAANIANVAAGGIAPRRDAWEAMHSEGYGQHGMPAIALNNTLAQWFNVSGAYAHVAPLSLLSGIRSEQLVRNPRAAVPTDAALASAMSRKGRHNEIGVALQRIDEGKQGDIMLHDAV